MHQIRHNSSPPTPPNPTAGDPMRHMRRKPSPPNRRAVPRDRPVDIPLLAHGTSDLPEAR
jgi:hypothetical protein